MSTTTQSSPTTVADPYPVRDRWPWFFRGFRDRYAVGYVRKHFHAVRLSRTSHPLPAGDDPLVVVLNHPAWWDPMICTVLTREFGGREHYAVIDDKELRKYGFFRRLGFFGVDPTSLRGAAEFLRTAAALLAKPNRVLWVTAQGEFADVRTRPLNLRGGVGHLAARLGRGIILPLAVEYTFWTERTPEALLRFGEPIDVAEADPGDGREWTARIEDALTNSLDVLNAETMSRDPALFTTLLTGRVGVGGFYDRWRKLKAWATGRSFDAAHDSRSSP